MLLLNFFFFQLGKHSIGKKYLARYENDVEEIKLLLIRLSKSNGYSENFEDTNYICYA